MDCDSHQDESWYSAEDLSKGLEPVPVRVAECDVSDISPFRYMPTNMVHGKAIVPCSLQSIGAGEFCGCGKGDCLNADIPCECAKETGGQFAYGANGLLRDMYLQQGISDATYCKEGEGCFCSSIMDISGGSGSRGTSCPGHVARTFIQECNVKCGCHSKCGNRIVQQGMRYSLEVFRTTRTGWGIRSNEIIPRGAFVFELTGEILTNREMIVRNFGCRDGLSYGLKLDADWATELVWMTTMRLCLDATHFGNVARFLNHRS